MPDSENAEWGALWLAVRKNPESMREKHHTSPLHEKVYKAVLLALRDYPVLSPSLLEVQNLFAKFHFKHICSLSSCKEEENFCMQKSKPFRAPSWPTYHLGRDLHCKHMLYGQASRLHQQASLLWHRVLYLLPCSKIFRQLEWLQSFQKENYFQLLRLFRNERLYVTLKWGEYQNFVICFRFIRAYVDRVTIHEKKT